MFVFTIPAEGKTLQSVMITYSLLHLCHFSYMEIISVHQLPSLSACAKINFHVAIFL